jgi:hypothetical protein
LKSTKEEARAEAASTTLPTCYFFRPIIDHDDHPDPIFQRLYLGLQRPLPHTLIAIGGYPLIIGSHHGLLLRKQIPTPAQNQLFCAASAPFRAFAQCPAFVPLGPAFE